MARFNAKTQPKYEAQRTTNLAGGPAFSQSWKEELVSILLTSMVQDQFYRSAQGGADRLQELVTQANDAEFVGKAGVYARREFGLRSISHILGYMVGEYYKGSWWTKSFFDQIVVRPDDMAEMLALVFQHKKPIPNAMKKGFAKALTRFDEYQLAKYRMDGKKVKLVDIVNLVHPYANAQIDALMQGKVKPAETWETQVSAAGKAEDKAEATKEAWITLLQKNKLGYMALIKNLRNISAVVTGNETTQLLLDRMTDEKAIKNSRLLPFRFVTAYEEIDKAVMPTAIKRVIMDGLEKATETALSNVPRFVGPTLIILDQSGSMDTRVGTSTAARVGALFTSILWKSNPDSDVITFGTSARYEPEKLRSNSLLNTAGVLGIASQGGTNFSVPFTKAQRAYDRIIILSDMQGWMEAHTPFDGAFANYCKKFKVKPHLYSFDLCGYGSLQFPEDRVYLLAGFSDKIFDVMKMLETDRNALIATIEKSVRFK